MTTTRSAADLAEVRAFLPCATPAAWFRQAPQHIDVLLIDHANCEKKAASTALAMLYRHVDRPVLLQRLSRLAREELRHFEQVLALMQSRALRYVPLTASRYASGLLSGARSREPGRLLDGLLVAAIVEARSCERFAGLVEVLPEDLSDLYRGLLACEVRHFRHYLALAEEFAGVAETGRRLSEFLTTEADLVTRCDSEFRFHSGPLAEP